MGYVGNQTTNSYSSMDKQVITGNGGASYTLTHAVANAQEIEVFVNNVRQEPGVAYTVSGTALTMTGNVASTDDFYVIYQGKALQTTVPPDDSVTTARINDGAVTTAKLGANAVTEAKMFSGFANGTTELDIWVNPSNIVLSSASGADFTNLQRWSTLWEKIGTGMTENSGVFTFPSTGKWKCSGKLYATSDGTAYYHGIRALVSTDSGSSYENRGIAYQGATSNEFVDTTVFSYLDVTDTSTFRIKFQYEMHSAATIYGNASTYLLTFFVFEKLADT